MIKPLATTSGFVPTASTGPARVQATAPEIRDSVSVEGSASAPAAKGKVGWGGKTMLMGLLAAGAVMGPLGMGAAQAAPLPTATVQVDHSAGDVMSHFTSNDFNRNSGGQHPMGQFRGGNSGGSRANNSYRPQAQQRYSGSGRSSFGTFGQQRSFPTQRQNFPSQGFGRQTWQTPHQSFGAPGRAEVRPGTFAGGHTYNVNGMGMRNRIVNINHWGGDRWGGGHPWGFYSGDSFWAGYLLGEDWAMMTDPYMFMQQPVYVMSPVTGYDCGQIVAPGGGAFSSQMQAQLAVLQTMANPQQDPNQPYDSTAGLYVDNGNFDASSPGMKIEPAYAYNLLNHGQGVVFHPPNGDFEQLQGLGDLAPYVVTQQAPAAQ